jgi:hypothetical protein
VTFGVWTGLTLGAGPTIFGLALALGLFVQVVDGWTIVLGVAVFLAYLGLYGEAAYLLATWGINGGLLIWKYRADLATPPQLRPRVWQGVRWFSERISYLYVKRPSQL